MQVSGGINYCQECIKKEEEDYKKVFQFFTEKPSATAQEISTETGVELKEIFRFARENRLQLVKTDATFHCEKCGAPVRNGKICDSCRKKLSEEIKTDIDKFKVEHHKGNEKYSIQRDKDSGNIVRRKTK
jgi:uncharacterized protein